MSTSAILSIIGCVVAGAATAIILVVKKVKENKRLKEENIRMQERYDVFDFDDDYGPIPRKHRKKKRRHKHTVDYYEPEPEYIPPAPPSPRQQDGLVVTIIKTLADMGCLNAKPQSFYGGANMYPTYYSGMNNDPYGYNRTSETYYGYGGNSGGYDDLDRFFSGNPWNRARAAAQAQWNQMSGASYPSYMRNPYPDINNYYAWGTPFSPYTQPYGYGNSYSSGTDRQFAEKTARIDSNGNRYDANGCKLYVDQYGNVCSEPYGGFRYDMNGNQYDGYGNLVRRANDVLPQHREEQQREVQRLRYGYTNNNVPPTQNPAYNSGYRYLTPDELDRLSRERRYTGSNYDEYNFIDPNYTRRNNPQGSIDPEVDMLIKSGKINYT